MSFLRSNANIPYQGLLYRVYKVIPGLHAKKIVKNTFDNQPTKYLTLPSLQQD